MKTLNLILFCLLLSICLKAQVPGMMSYQGYVTDPATNKPVTDGVDYSITFKFYDGATEIPALERTVSNVSVTKGLFTVIIGSETTGSNASLPVGIWNKPLTVGVTAKKGTAAGNEIVPRVTLTSTPYAFTAQVANSVSAANIVGTLLGSQIGTGVSAANITTGALPITVLNTDLQDLADGSLSGSKVGTGIDATNVTAGILPNSVLDADIADLGDGTLNAAGYITTVGGVHVGGTADPGTDNLSVDGFTKLGVEVGVPLIKMKKFTGTTAAAQNSTVQITHGLTSSKILSVSLLVEYSAGNFVPNSFTHFAGYEVNYYVTALQIVVANVAANSGSVTTKPFTLLITYEQ